MKLLHIAAALSATAAVAAAPHAKAATYDLIFTGALLQGEDTLNLFGGAVQTGDPLSVTYRYDTDLGGTRTALAGVYDEIDTNYPFTPAAITQVTLRLDGQVYTYTPDFQASVSIGRSNFDWLDGAYDVDGASASGQSLNGDNSAMTFGIDGKRPLPTSLTMPTYFTGYGLGYMDTAFSGLNNDSDNFIFETYSVSVSAAPEPAEWLMMILAVAGAGAGLRLERRRRTALGAAV